MSIHKRARLYCGYNDSTAETTESVNIWEPFPAPSTSITSYRSNGDFTIDSANGLKFKYTGELNIWVKLEVVSNIYKGSGGNSNRNVEVVWYLNDNPIGAVTGSYMNNQDSQILTGIGEVMISPNDELVPMIRNIENSDKINVKNCTFNFVEDFDWGY